MSKTVQIPKNFLYALGGLLVLSLVATAYLFGRQNAPVRPEEPTSTASPQPIPLPDLEQKTLDSRVVDLENRIGTLQKRPLQKVDSEVSSKGAAESSLEKSGDTDLVARRAYFDQLNSILGRTALEAPEPMATRLLDQVMNSTQTDRFESALAQTSQAEAEVVKLEAPSSCLEHKKLVLSQLKFSLLLLEKVRASLDSGDSGKLDSLSEVDDTMLEQAVQLRDLDRSLRP